MAITGQAICLAVGLLFLLGDWRNGRPMLLAELFFLPYELTRPVLTAQGLIQRLPCAGGAAKIAMAAC